MEDHRLLGTAEESTAFGSVMKVQDIKGTDQLFYQQWSW
jgi:hypothetical protein